MKIYLKKLIYTGFIILLGFTCLAQQAFPPNGIIFQDNIVPRIDIIINPDSLSQILEPGNEESNHVYPAIFIFTNNSEDGKVIQFSNEKFTLIEALAKAGGVSEYGKTYKIKLLRGDLNNPEIFLFNIRRIEDVKNANFQLQANDIIYVESRSRYAAKTLQEITPYLTLFTTFFTIYLLIKK